MIYYSNGTRCDIGDISEVTTEFYIKDLGEEYQDRFIYHGDALRYELDCELVALYDKLRDIFFDDTAAYYKELSKMPIFVQDAGQSSDCRLTADLFSKLIQAKRYRGMPNFNKHLYLVDCHFLVGTIQNLLSGMEDAFVNYFIRISNINTVNGVDEQNLTIFEMSKNVNDISAGLENYFVKAYSILDILCKIFFEIQNPQKDFSKYINMKSAKLLWGDKKKLTINTCQGTLFENCDLVIMIESMRNEVVHNGSWELKPKVYIRFEKGELAERFMLFPDISQGRLAKVKGRNHFFGDGTKVNDVLPRIHKEYQFRLLKTIRLLNNYSITD